MQKIEVNARALQAVVEMLIGPQGLQAFVGMYVATDAAMSSAFEAGCRQGYKEGLDDAFAHDNDEPDMNIVDAFWRQVPMDPVDLYGVELHGQMTGRIGSEEVATALRADDEFCDICGGPCVDTTPY